MTGTPRAGQFSNLVGYTWRQNYPLLLLWRLTRRLNLDVWFPRTDPLPGVRPNDGSGLGEGSHLTWIGHASFLMRLGGRVIAIDPMWSPRCVYVKRLRPVGVALEHLPRVDLVTISHNHFDHLDLPTLQRLADRFAPTILVPLRVGKVLRKRGLQRVLELDWWESHTEGSLRVTFVPAQHWSARGPFDVNRTLWGGFVYQAPEGTAYHGGDSAFDARLFQEIARRFPAIDWAMLPIGSYAPEWFLRTQHMNPEDAGKAFELLGAKRFVAAHYGTFRLTDERDGEPLRRTVEWFRSRSLMDRLWTLEIGETRDLADRA